MSNTVGTEIMLKSSDSVDMAGTTAPTPNSMAPVSTHADAEESEAEEQEDDAPKKSPKRSKKAEAAHIQGLREAIQLQRELLALYPKDGNTEEREGVLSKISKDMESLIKEVPNELDLINETLEYRRELLAMTPKGHTKEASRFHQLATVEMARYRVKHELCDLEQAIRDIKKAIPLRVPGSSDHITSMGNLSIYLDSIYKKSKKMETLEENIALLREMHEIVSNEKSSRKNKGKKVEIMKKLASKLRDRSAKLKTSAEDTKDQAPESEVSENEDESTKALAAPTEDTPPTKPSASESLTGNSTSSSSSSWQAIAPVIPEVPDPIKTTVKTNSDTTIRPPPPTHSQTLPTPRKWWNYPQLYALLGLKPDPSSEYTCMDWTSHISLNRDTYAGGGRYGDVYQGSWKGIDKLGLEENPPDVAVKVIRFGGRGGKGGDHGKIMKQIRREITIWQGLMHENVVPFLGIIRNNGYPCLVSVWMKNGTASEYIIEHPEADRGKIVIGIALGLEYLHGCLPNSIVHGDLKADNILIDAYGNPGICDFGISTLKLDSTLWLTNATQARGTLRWMAPELLEGDQVMSTTKTDVWGYAMTAFEIMTGNIPFCGSSEGRVISLILIEGTNPERPTGEVVSDAMWDLWEKCWSRDPLMRPDMTRAIWEMRKMGL